MMRMKRIVSLALLLVAVAAMLPAQAFAAGKIDPAKEVSFTISYHDGEKPIPNAEFEIFRVADINEYAEMTLTEEFEKYRSTVSGLSNLHLMDQDGWKLLAETLKGVVAGDSVVPLNKGTTSESGILNLTLLPGLYLVVGHSSTTSDSYIYTPLPFMAFLPGADPENNVWSYNVTASPKYSKTKEENFISRKVLKIWDDRGYESVRPENVTVHLLCDGENYDTAVLSSGNNWRFSWEKLDASHEWTLTEDPIENYSVSVSLTGITFAVKNSYNVPVSDSDILVQKRITGSVLTAPGVFTFVLAAADPSYPMPAGSEGGVKEATLFRAGYTNMGRITFSKPGTYVYKIYEKNTGISGYTYDNTVYVLTYNVSVGEDGRLHVSRTITTGSGTPVSSVIFSNHYNRTLPILPQTGQIWWPVPVLAAAGVLLIFLGLVYRRRYSH